MAQVSQEETCWVVLRQLLLAVCVEHVVLLEELLCDLQDLVVECKPGILTDNAQHLRIAQAAAGQAHCCSGTWGQKASASTNSICEKHKMSNAALFHLTNACIPAKSMQSGSITSSQCEGVLLNVHGNLSHS